MPSALERAILKTIVYADLFDYPLIEEEVWKRLIKCSNVTMKQCNNEINKIKIVQEKDRYFFLKGRQHIVSLGQERKKYSQKKLKIAQKITNLLRFIPTVKLVGVTGGLTIGNAEKEDDIDLFIITSSGLLWTTRLLTTLLVELTGGRRHPEETFVNNKICLNMFIDEDHLVVPKKERDLFAAHEVVQMKPLFERGGIYQKFLKVNQWVKEYLPNAIKTKNLELRTKKRRKRVVAKLFNCYIVTLLHCFELLLKNLQLFYMRKRRTTEVITDGIIRFHPQDAREWVLRRYMEKLKEYQILDR